jgi:hypothetical protein
MPAIQLEQYLFSQALGLSTGAISGWRANGSGTAGAIMDFATLAGFGPDQVTLERLETAYEGKEERNTYPRNVYAMLDTWEMDASPAFECWAAFSGGGAQVEAIGAPLGLAGRRGAPAATFSQLYEKHLPVLQPRLLDVIHWKLDADGGPLRREDHRKTVYGAEFIGGSAAGGVQATQGPSRKQEKRPDRNTLRTPPLPRWLTGETAFFEHELPTPGASMAEMAAKAQLYGGRPPIQLSVRDLAALHHTFDREVVKRLSDAIKTASARCCSFTLKAGRGAGLSIALAQLERDLGEDPGTKVLSIINDPVRTVAALEALDDKKAAELAAWAGSQGEQLDRLVVIIDDVSSSSSAGRHRLNRFRNRCKIEFSTYEGPKLAFVFGSFGNVVTFSEDGDFDLEITKGDRGACYLKMIAEPAVIVGLPGGLNEVLTRHPVERSLGDDAQAMIDHLLEHGRPKLAFIEHWLSRIDDLRSDQVSVIALTAAAQLVGLAVPERVMSRLFAAQGRRDVDIDEIAAGRLMVVGEPGRGEASIGLSCPRRAESILRRSNRYNPPFLIDVYGRILRAAIADFLDKGAPAMASMDFARHILQRLGKTDLFLFDPSLKVSKQHVSERVINRFLYDLGSDPLIYHFSNKWEEFDEKAKWAGTLAAHLKPIRQRTSSGWVTAPAYDYQEHCAWFVGRLCGNCLEVIERTPDAATPEVALSLLRAGRLLLRSKYHKRDAQSLADDLDRVFSGDHVLRLLGVLLDEETKEPMRRANEVIHTYAQFQGVRGWRARRGVSAWIEAASHVLQNRGIPLDAGTWIERASVTWRTADTDQERAAALPDVRAFLERARDSIEFDPLVQATWRKHLLRVQKDVDGGPAVEASDDDLGDE